MGKDWYQQDVTLVLVSGGTCGTDTQDTLPGLINGKDWYQQDVTLVLVSGGTCGTDTRDTLPGLIYQHRT